MNIAIVQDDIVRRGGAEQVALSFHHAFPSAPIYTLSYDPDASYDEFRNADIRTSWFGKYIKKEEMMKKLFFPFGLISMQRLDLTSYDVILQSATHCAKYVKTNPNALVITYCHTPFRLVWRPESYESVANAKGIKKIAYQFVIDQLKRVERRSAQRTTWFLTNSSEVLPRIVQAYEPQREITIISPSVKCKNFYVAANVSDYFLVVSRFEPYKKVDLVIEAFRRMPDKKLIVVGKGSRKEELQAIAPKNVSFLSGLSSVELADVYAKCKALIFPQLEDYGITPLEANASGRPVIAYGKGGVLDTMIAVNGSNAKGTAVFFNEQSAEAICEAVTNFDKYVFDPYFIRAHAEGFDEAKFVQRIRDYVISKYRSFAANNYLSK
ncbi:MULTISPECIES: glycosyltransferase [Olivibacter]|uniref:Glycosyltransferase n=1 Tax=Olivibacter jilunii TaxID=985016 RepID=A0ABW6B7S3_9SPHI|nr:glycosyltransferase [Olivibacter sp. UJ_SKK_5.1]MDX3912870.1 glycosyltransferase [Pseudosphingobacterium sp.]